MIPEELQKEIIGLLGRIYQSGVKAGLLKGAEIAGVVEMPHELFHLDAKTKYWVLEYVSKISEAITEADK